MADIDMPLAWRMQQDGYLMQINQLRDENVKLRGLCHDLDASRRDAIAMYMQSEESYICESSGEIAADLDRLDEECEKLLNQFNARLYELGVQA